MFGAGNTCVKLQSRVTSSGAVVVILISFFLSLSLSLSLGELGVDGMGEFFERQRVARVVVWSTLFFWII